MQEVSASSSTVRVDHISCQNAIPHAGCCVMLQEKERGVSRNESSTFADLLRERVDCLAHSNRSCFGAISELGGKVQSPSNISTLACASM